MIKIIDAIESAKKEFRNRIEWIIGQGGITPDMYARLLSVEYHLTNGVQRHFLIAASHPDLASRRKLREFLCGFATEEELHYRIALKDLENMGRQPYECNLDVKFWRAYFDSVVYDRPFLRLGGTCILENITSGSSDLIPGMLKAAPFLNAKNTHFVTIHQHGDAIPHGDEILEALTSAKLDEGHLQDLEEGCRISSLLFLRMIDWCLTGDEFVNSPFGVKPFQLKKCG